MNEHNDSAVTNPGMGNELVIYEMHVGTFHVKDEDHVGTFDTAIEKLPYLQELGINGVEIMPALPRQNQHRALHGGDFFAG
ncbi:MAG: hypothetical protein M8357_06040 [Desulfobulbaceae bacterium]|nr:hypothetical protein [Desulfobulbaceae bacterium]